MESKGFWKSKTVIYNSLLGLLAIISGLGFIPNLHEWVQANSSVVLGGISVVGLTLRLVTSGKILIWE